MRKKPQFVPVTPRALFQRVNRALAKRSHRLIVNRRTAVFPDLGNLYIVDVNRNYVEKSHVDLEELGRELGVLKPYECLEKERP